MEENSSRVTKHVPTSDPSTETILAANISCERLPGGTLSQAGGPSVNMTAPPVRSRTNPIISERSTWHPNLHRTGRNAPPANGNVEPGAKRVQGRAAAATGTILLRTARPHQTRIGNRETHPPKPREPPTPNEHEKHRENLKRARVGEHKGLNDRGGRDARGRQCTCGGGFFGLRLQHNAGLNLHKQRASQPNPAMTEPQGMWHQGTRPADQS